MRLRLSGEHIVFIDETGLTPGRCGATAAPRRSFVRGHSHGHRRTTTFVVGLRLGGVTAPMFIDGAMNGDAFLACVRRVLVLRPGDSVVMDNIGCHNCAKIPTAIEAAEAELRFLPPARWT